MAAARSQRDRTADLACRWLTAALLNETLARQCHGERFTPGNALSQAQGRFEQDAAYARAMAADFYRIIAQHERSDDDG